MYQHNIPRQLFDSKWENDALWGLRLNIGNNTVHVLTKQTYNPLGSFVCMRIILGTCEEIVQEETDRLWHDGFTLLYVNVWLSLASSSFQIQKVVTIRFSVHLLRTQNTFQM